MNVNQTKTTCFVFACLAMLLLPFQLLAEGPVVEKPHTFSSGTPARASEVNENFDRAYEHIQKLVRLFINTIPQNQCARQQSPRKPGQTISA